MVGSSVPRELVDAFGLESSRMLPPGSVESESRGEILSGPGFCSWCKSALGSPESEALWIGGATCDQMRRCLELAGRKSGSRSLVIHVPKIRTDEAEEFFRSELVWLYQELERLTGARPSDDALRAAIASHNEKRRLLREIRSGLSGGDFVSLLHLDALLPAAEMVAFLKDVRPAPPRTEGFSVMIAGGPSTPADLRWLDTIEDTGMRIVADATGTGDRAIDFEVDPGADPLAGLARAYFRKPPSIWVRPNDAFYDYAGTLARKRSVRAVIWRSWKGCDVWSLESRRAVQKLGIPLLALDMTFGDIDSARIKTRLAAFRESLR